MRRGRTAPALTPPPGAPLPTDAGPSALTANEFTLFQAFIEREAGIHLGETKAALLTARLGRRVRELHLPSFGAYYQLITAAGAEDERDHMLDCVTTNETRFFREPRHFELIAEQLCPRWSREADAGARERQVRAWSAGCSSGEEPYSLAMVLLDRFPPSSGWHVQILATDLSTRVLARARDGLWPLEKAADVPKHYRKSFMLRGVRSQEGRMKAGPEIRAVVDFSLLNLNAARWSVAGRFDLIFCRNVLIYFQAEARTRITSRLIEYLAPGGHLFLGHAETLHAMSGAGLRTVIPTVYTRPQAAAPAGGPS